MDPFTFVATLAGFASVVATVVSTTYAYGSSVIDANEAVKDFLTELQALRILLQQLETMIVKMDNPSPHFPEISAKLVPLITEGQTSLQTLHSKLEKRQNTSKMRGVIKRLGWPLAEADTLKAVNMLARYRGQFQLALSMDTWNLASLTLSTVEEYGEKQNVFQMNARNQENLEWISSYNYQLKYETVGNMRTANTRKWLIESTTFVNFSLGSSHALWCRGIPGAGKSVSSSIVIAHLSSMSEHTSTAVAYHFFDYLTAEEQSPDLLCRSLLKQLAEQYSEPLPDMERLRKDMFKQNRKPNQTDLMPLIEILVNKFSTVFIVLDALDECFEGYRHTVLDIISHLHSFGTKVFATTRPHIEPPKLKNDEWEYIQMRAHDEDIMKVFETTLQQKDRLRKRLSQDFKNEIVAVISEKADGMFLWVSLQISQILSNHTPTLIRRALQNMPSKIFDVFTDTLERIGNDELARGTLFWLSRTDEPLQFSALAHALALDPEYITSEGIDADDIPSIEDLVEICCGLVTVDADMNIRFVHFTVQEYFSQHPECLLPLNDLVIAKACLLYLSFKEFESGYCDSEEKMHQRLEKYPLYSFAARRWNHFVPKHEEHQVVDAIMHIYLHDSLYQSYAQVRFVEWSNTLPHEVKKYFEFQHGYSPLHDATDVGIFETVEKLLPQLSSPSPEMRRGITPLHLAVAHKRSEIVSLLMMAGADQTSPAILTVGGVTSGHVVLIKSHQLLEVTSVKYNEIEIWAEQYTPVALAAAVGSQTLYDLLKDSSNANLMGGVLETAVSRGLEEMVQQVLDDCPSIDFRHPSFAKALQISFASPQPMFKLLLKARPELDDREGTLSKLLPDAIRYHPETVDMLVQRGASVDGWQCEHWWYSPLSAAFVGSEESMIIYLIEKGANISAPNNLCRAVTKRMKKVVELLLDRGTDINGYPPEHNAALHRAAYSNDVEMMELLLDRGADIELAPIQVTALAEAAGAGHIDAVKMLIGRGANVNVPGGNASPLEKAATYAIAELLLDHGADINAISGCNDYITVPTALCSAVRKGNLDLCELLLSRGADPNFPLIQNSPLMVACAKKNPDIKIIELLLKYGADPNAGCPALEHAVCRGDESIVRLLLQHGAQINIKGGTHGSILHAALSSPNKKMVQIMLERGARIMQGEGTRGSLLAYARPFHYSILIKHGADINAESELGSVLHAAIVHWYLYARQNSSIIIETIRFLLEAGAAVNQVGGAYHTALQIAARTGHLALVTLLLDHGAEVGLVGGCYGNALQAAAYRGSESVVTVLLKAGADIHQTGGKYHTALQAAATLGHEAVVKVLLEYNADVNAEGGKYGNALRAARYGGYKVVGQLLTRAGAIDSFDPDGGEPDMMVHESSGFPDL